MKSKLVIKSVNGCEREVAQKMFDFEGITKAITLTPEAIIAEVETDSPEKLELFIKEQLSNSDYIKAVEPVRNEMYQH